MSIEKINGQRFNTFEEFYKLLKKSTGEFVALADSTGYEIAIDRVRAESGHRELMEQYRIQQDHSREIDRWNQELASPH
jgi:hypothetical protein